MSCQLCPNLVNICLCHHETKFLENCLKIYETIFYERFVDTIFVLFEKAEQVLPFAIYMKKVYSMVTFCFKLETLFLYSRKN